MKRIAFFMAMAFLCLMILAACGERPAETGEKVTFTVVVVNDKGEEASHSVTSTRTHLADALLDEKIVTGKIGAYGLEIESVDGLVASWDKDQAYWALYIGEDYAMTGASGIKLESGATYRLVYTKG